MKRYAIGLSGFDEDIEVVILESKDELNAMCDAVLNKFGWEVRSNGEVPFITMDEGIDFILQGEINISKPVEI